MDESLEIAKSIRSVSVSDRGPLYGIPLSVKECFFVKGYDSTAGEITKK
jgi:Asp-tRNA(Asn)/Glu-tRNA(Gln) amidotransferase A subunit family amidase